MLCIRATGHFKLDDPEQPPSGAKSQLALAAQFMNVKPRAARATSGHATTPPRSVMNSRRRMGPSHEESQPTIPPK
jgi:hypothetical protein